ncbi:nuclear transport factor 2 family protein [Nocardia sp. NPDC050630]|uniref:nuclear transport factor 2 family protein n=1 Tax=Nocardia sp. NPDC050630 TaxID=3364321 RepID=UPI0037A7559B
MRCGRRTFTSRSAHPDHDRSPLARLQIRSAPPTLCQSQRADIVDTATRMFWYIDIRDWDSFTGLFANLVTLDYSSIWGGEPATVAPDAIRADWSKLLGAFDATQHLIGNHLGRVS